MHPIFQWLDYRYKDYGGFAKVTDDRFIGGFRNRLVAGVNILNGSIDNQQFANIRAQGRAAVIVDRWLEEYLGLYRGQLLLPAERGGDRRHAIPLRHAQPAGSLPQQWRPVGIDRVQYLVAEGRPALEHRSDLAGLCQHLAERRDTELAKASRPGRVIPFTSIRPQTATTYEIGTRMQRPDLTLGTRAYRADIRNELQCLLATLTFGTCNVINADRTIHQGIEAGAGAAIFRASSTTARRRTRSG